MSSGPVQHDYHLADPSPWPFLGAIAVGISLLGAVMWLNAGTDMLGMPPFIRPYICLGGLLLLAFTLTGWWRDMVAESVRFGEFKPVARLAFRFAMVLMLLAEAVYFAGLFCVSFDLASVSNGWPPPKVFPDSPWGIPLLVTLMLLLSATVAIWAARAIAHGERKQAIQALAVLVALGGGAFAFLCYDLHYAPVAFGFNGAIFEPMSDAAHINLVSVIGSRGAAYGSFFYLAIGSFCVHLAVATLFMLVALIRAAAGHFAPERHLGFVTAAWVWHFCVIIWLLLYFGVYVAGGGFVPRLGLF